MLDVAVESMRPVLINLVRERDRQCGTGDPSPVRVERWLCGVVDSVIHNRIAFCHNLNVQLGLVILDIVKSAAHQIGSQDKLTWYQKKLAHVPP